jgi:hypothetical protein
MNLMKAMEEKNVRCEKLEGGEEGGGWGGGGGGGVVGGIIGVEGRRWGVVAM